MRHQHAIAFLGSAILGSFCAPSCGDFSAHGLSLRPKRTQENTQSVGDQENTDALQEQRPSKEAGGDTQVSINALQQQGSLKRRRTVIDVMSPQKHAKCRCNSVHVDQKYTEWVIEQLKLKSDPQLTRLATTLKEALLQQPGEEVEASEIEKETFRSLYTAVARSAMDLQNKWNEDFETADNKQDGSVVWMQQAQRETWGFPMYHTSTRRSHGLVLRHAINAPTHAEAASEIFFREDFLSALLNLNFDGENLSEDDNRVRRLFLKNMF